MASVSAAPGAITSPLPLAVAWSSSSELLTCYKQAEKYRLAWEELPVTAVERRPGLCMAVTWLTRHPVLRLPMGPRTWACPGELSSSIWKSVWLH